MAVPFPEVDIKTQYVKFYGGLDLETDMQSISPGALLDGVNYQPGQFGGYERIDAIERYDGRAAPSDATYYYATYTKSATVLVGQSVTGTTSGATGTVALVTDTEIVLTKVVGTFVSGETFKKDAGGPGGLPLLLTMTYGAATVIGTFTMTPTLRGYDDAESDAIALNAAADIYRVDVGVVPGESAAAVVGVWLYRGELYAFRSDVFIAPPQTMSMWKATSTGWVKIDLGEEISFDAGTDEVLDGDTLTQGAATATIARVVQTTSDEDPNREGRLILTSRTGNFTDGHAVTSSGGLLNLTGASTQIVMLAGGSFQFDNYNFQGSTDTLKMYGADGTNRMFEFDGTTFVPISTGMDVDTPDYIRCHKQQLFASLHGSSQNSGVGLPYVWTTVTGANEIGVGDDISGYAVMPGEALAIMSRNSMRQLTGSTVDDFVLKNISDKRGAIPRTVQEMGQTYCLGDAGIVQVSPTQAYGNFAENIVSRRVQPLINTLRTKTIASTVYRHRNQYRVYGNDGTGLIMAVGVDARGNQRMQFTEFDYNSGRTTDLINVTCVVSGEDQTGKDVVFFGATNGYVYQCEKGTSFDGNDIEHYLRMPYGDAKSPEIIKRYRGIGLEMKAEGFTSIRFSPDFSYGDPAIATHQPQTADVIGRGAFWGSNAANWSEFFYDAQVVSTPRFKIEGSGVNLAMLFYGKSDYHASHTLSGATIRYTPRRLRPN